MLQSVSKMNPGSGAGDLLNQFCHLLEQHGTNLDQIGKYISSTAAFYLPQRGQSAAEKKEARYSLQEQQGSQTTRTGRHY